MKLDKEQKIDLGIFVGSAIAAGVISKSISSNLCSKRSDEETDSILPTAFFLIFGDLQDNYPDELYSQDQTKRI